MYMDLEESLVDYVLPDSPGFPFIASSSDNTEIWDI